MTRKFIALGLLTAALLVSSKAHAVSGAQAVRVDNICTLVGKLGHDSAVWRNEGKPYGEVVRDFNSGANKLWRNYDAQQINDAKRLFDIAIYDAYQYDMLQPGTVGELEYGHCVAFFKGTQATPKTNDEPDSDLASPPPMSQNVAPAPPADGSL